jgi:uncharacterized membrane protein
MPMTRIVLPVIGGLLLGGIIHIAIVFMMPYYADADAWAQMQQFGPDGQFHVLPPAEAGAEPIPALDPQMMQAVCRFTLEDGPIRMRATLPQDFWSVGVFDRRGRNVYSLNNGAVDGSQLDLAILTPLQMAQLREDPPESLETAIVLEVPIDDGFGLLRVFVPDESLKGAATDSLSTADCSAEL